MDTQKPKQSRAEINKRVWRAVDAAFENDIATLEQVVLIPIRLQKCRNRPIRHWRVSTFSISLKASRYDTCSRQLGNAQPAGAVAAVLRRFQEIDRGNTLAFGKRG